MDTSVKIDWEKVEEIIEKYKGSHEALLMIMQDISDLYNYVPPDVVPVLVEKLGVKESLVYSVATFYKTISLEPRGKYKEDQGTLISLLQDIQSEFGYLPKEVLSHVSGTLDVPLSKIFAVASFYHSFSLEPQGKNTVSVCTGTACHVRGAEKITDALEENLEIEEGQTSGDGLFTLEAVRCIGCCASGPVITVNKDTHGGLDRSSVLDIVDQYKQHAS